MTTIHAFTNDQVLTDVYHSDMRRARSAIHSMIPTKTGAAKAIGLVLPELAGKFDGLAIRVPLINVSVVDLTFVATRATTVDELNEIISGASKMELSGILGFNADPLVSVDFNHDPRPSIYDATQTRVSKDGKLVKVMAWYDNEWGYSVQMLNVALALMAA
jgi:glyceraldehyde 3-phosphate dehydrogenase